MQCILVTPEATLRDEPADFVALPLFDGEIGIAAGHSPMIGRLGCGEMRIRRGQETARFYVEGGFVQVLKDTISVLCNRALKAEEVDVEATEELLHTTLTQPAHTPESLATRQRTVDQARAQLLVARRAQ
jgi:F-type H+-transporting ATPase subunit epsilon